MALNFFATINASKQGVIRGESIQKGREGKIIGRAFAYEVNLARDPATGLPLDARVHGPVTMTRESGFASVQLYEALFTHELLTSVLFEFLRPQQAGATGTGIEVIFQTITLHDAYIVGIKNHLELNLDTTLMKYPQLEEVAFEFAQIDIHSVKPDAVASDKTG